jgi:hypothetical protein
MEATLESIKKNMISAVAMQNKMKTRMKEQLSKMPEEQRKVLETQMENAEKQAKTAPPKVETKATGKAETIQGLKCEVFTVSIANKVVKETCIAKEGINEKDMAQLQNMFDFMKNIAVETAKIRGLPAPDAGLLPNYNGGLAIKTQALPGGAKSELSKLSTGTLDDQAFAIPAGYDLFDPKAAASKALPNAAPKVDATPSAPTSVTASPKEATSTPTEASSTK